MPVILWAKVRSCIETSSKYFKVSIHRTIFFFGCLSNNKYKFEIDIKKIPFFGYKDHFLAWKLIYLELRAKMLEIIKYD